VGGAINNPSAGGGGGAGGGGVVTYSSGAAINPVGTQYVAIGGGGQASILESDVRIGAPSAATISDMFVNLDLPPGIGNSIAFTWRKAGSDQTLTCTVSGAVATTCSDTTHSFTVAQGDLIDIKLVTTGSVIVAPGLTIATAYGATSSTTNQNIRAISFIFDGAGSALSGTLTRCQQINYAGTIQEATLTADQSGSATVDVQTVAFGSYTGPGSASTITAADTPALSSAVKYQDSTLTGWTTSLTANTVVCMVLSSPSTVTWVSGNIKVAAN
jgi:hypothetical protein